MEAMNKKQQEDRFETLESRVAQLMRIIDLLSIWIQESDKYEREIKDNLVVAIDKIREENVK